MSKQLYINDKRVFIDEEKTYFPFSYTINDLETVNVINIPGSKTIEIPRCPVNDEIFGYIGEFSRITISSDDDKANIMFNQTKKCYYKLYSDSELVSNGLVIVTSLTPNTFEIQLKDELMDKLEELNDVYLNELDIYNSSNNIISFPSNVLNVRDHLLSTDLIPTFNIKEFDLPKDKLICKDSETNKLSSITLPTECSPLQARTYKNYEVDYVMPINSLINTINHNGYNINVDNKVSPFFKEVNVLCNKPTNISISEFGNVSPSTELSVTATTQPPTNSNTAARLLTKVLLNGDHSINKNGTYYIKLDVNIDVTNPYSNIDNLYSIHYGNELKQSTITRYVYALTGVPANTNEVIAQTGDYIGDYWIDIELAKTYLVDPNNGITYKPQLFRYKIKLLLNKNCWFNFDTKTCHINTIVPISTDFYYSLFNGDVAYLDIRTTNRNPDDANEVTYLFGTFSTSVITTNQSTYTFKNLDFRTGDIIKGQTILPKVSVKDFIINTCKFFNLGLTVKNNALYIFKKVYSKSNLVPILDTIDNTDLGLISFNKLILSTNISSDQLMDDYKTNTDKKYGEQIINTGYSIKETKKEVNFEVSVPFLMDDYNAYAYDSYCKCYSGGYNINNHGNIYGLNDKLVFGFLNRVENNPPTKFSNALSVVNDSTLEIKNIVHSSILNEVTDTEFQMYAPNITYFADSGEFKFNSADDVNYKTIDSYYTFSPYKIDTNGNVAISLEMNKPLYNYTSNIYDENYQDDKTLYSIFHKKMLTDKYNVNTNIIKAKMFLDGKVNPFLIYNIKNTNYIMSKLPEYDPTIPNMYEVELMKVNNVDNYINTFNPVKGEIELRNVTSIADSHITGEFEILFDGWTNINSKGICWTTGDTAYWRPDYVAVTNPSNISTFDTGALSNNTIYRLRAYIETDAGLTYSNQIEVRTLSTPYVSTTAITSIANTTAYSGGNSIIDNGSPITQKGICWGTSVNPTISGSYSINGSGNSDFTYQMTGLAENTTYYVRAYTTNSIGTSYGNQLSFKTLGLPIVETVSIVSITSSSCVVNTNVVSGAGHSIIERGICWDTTGTPNIGGDFTDNGTGTGTFATGIIGLIANTTYYARSYAINSVGISYGEIISFTTSMASEILVTTLGSPIVTSNSTATVKGNLTNTGGNLITQKGICYVKDPGIPLITDLAISTSAPRFQYMTINSQYGVWLNYKAAIEISAGAGSLINASRFKWTSIRANLWGYDNVGIVWNNTVINYSFDEADFVQYSIVGGQLQCDWYKLITIGSGYHDLMAEGYLPDTADDLFISLSGNYTDTITAYGSYMEFYEGFSNHMYSFSPNASLTPQIPDINDLLNYYNDDSLGEYTRYLTELLPDTTYYYRAYAKTDNNYIGYGDVYNFKTTI